MGWGLVAVSLFCGSVMALIEKEEQWSLEAQEEGFQAWMAQHNKDYFNIEEYKYRFEVWRNAHAEIALHNARPEVSFTKEMNKFGDLTSQEFQKLYLGMKPSQGKEDRQDKWLSEEGLPNAMSWVDKGAVTPIKDQGGCGSCWAFSATGSLEGAYFLQGNALTSFSEEQLVECSHP